MKRSSREAEGPPGRRGEARNEQEQGACENRRQQFSALARAAHCAVDKRHERDGRETAQFALDVPKAGDSCPDCEPRGQGQQDHEREAADELADVHVRAGAGEQPEQYRAREGRDHERSSQRAEREHCAAAGQRHQTHCCDLGRGHPERQYPVPLTGASNSWLMGQASGTSTTKGTNTSAASAALTAHAA